VFFVKKFDERKGKDRAEEVTGGCEEPERGRGGGGGGGGAGGVSGPPPPGKSAGLVIRWSEKGFGFIKPEDGGEDIFCHSSCIDDGNALREGTTVHYSKEYDESKGKDRAKQVVGGVQEDRRPPPGGGGGYGGGGYGGGGYGGGGYGGGGYGGGGAGCASRRDI
jgi:cold shock CspA family protein